MRDIARFFSTVFNPFVTALALFIVITHETARDTPDFWRLCLLSISFTSILPMLFVVWLYTTGRISDLDMSVRTERERVFGFFVLSYVAGTIVLALLHAPMLLVAAMGGYAAAALLMQLITKFWKISGHALGIAAPLTILMYMYGQQPLPFLTLIPVVSWSRVYLGAHTVLQVVAGVALGIASPLLALRLLHLI